MYSQQAMHREVAIHRFIYAWLATQILTLRQLLTLINTGRTNSIMLFPSLGTSACEVTLSIDPLDWCYSCPWRLRFFWDSLENYGSTSMDLYPAGSLGLPTVLVPLGSLVHGEMDSSYGRAGRATWFFRVIHAQLVCHGA